MAHSRNLLARYVKRVHCIVSLRTAQRFRGWKHAYNICIDKYCISKYFGWMDPGQSRAEIDSVFVGRLLIGPLMSALFGAHDKALAPLGLTSRQGAVLLNCARREANTPVELAFYNGLDVSSMSRLLDRLEQRGLVTRERSGTDRRKVIVELTPKGSALVKKGMSLAAEVAKAAWGNVTEREREVFQRVVRKVLENLGHLHKS